VSVINKMLRDLDRRHALPDSASADPSVRVVPHSRRSDAFWITLALVAMLGLGWLSWVLYEMRPQPVATPLALSRPIAPAPMVAAAPPAKVQPPQPAQVQPAAPSATPPQAPAPELFKLAEAIETPLPPMPARKHVPKPAKLPPDQAIAPPGAAAKGVAGQLTKRDRPLSSAEEAELHFQKGVERLNQGRASAAALEFAGALAIDPSHEPARQALVAVRLEQSELDAAERLLSEGMALSPSNAQFATVLARIRVERGDYEGAAELLTRTHEAGAADPEHQLLLGTVLQRLHRDSEAIGAFENAARLAEPAPSTLVAMAMSYENLGRRAEALRAYRQALVEGPSPTLRGYAESRIAALK
jgi:MSHA biogenesis protein MshN